MLHNPFNAIVTPRPIGWISTRGTDGADNLAPCSFFNAVAYVPPQVMFASTSAKPDCDGTKDSVANIRETGVFCVNIVEMAMRDAMNATSATFARIVDEFAAAGIAKAACDTIACARIAAAPVNSPPGLRPRTGFPSRAPPPKRGRLVKPERGTEHGTDDRGDRRLGRL